jgi:branched-chain amino acid aminotransferase
MELARNELNLQVTERSIARTELYACDEAFFTGTAVEIAPIISVDHRPVGKGEIGPVTEKLRSLYFEATRGHIPGYLHWLQAVYGPDQLRKTA